MAKASREGPWELFAVSVGKGIEHIHMTMTANRGQIDVFLTREEAETLGADLMQAATDTPAITRKTDGELMCCSITCDKPAEWEIWDLSGPYMTTVACSAHVGSLLAVGQGNRVYPLTAPVARG